MRKKGKKVSKVKQAAGEKKTIKNYEYVQHLQALALARRDTIPAQDLCAGGSHNREEVECEGRERKELHRWVSKQVSVCMYYAFICGSWLWEIEAPKKINRLNRVTLG